MVGDSFSLELESAKRLLHEAGVPWGVAAGAAVYLYAGNRPPTDLDLLVPPDRMERVARLVGSDPKLEKTPWGESRKLLMGGIEMVGSLTIKIGDVVCSYLMDEEMIRHLRLLTYHGLEVPVLAPEDVIALKAVLQRGPDQGKHDLADIAALAAGLRVDRDYLEFRLGQMGGAERARGVLQQWGWASG